MKTTAYGKETPFYVTKNELDTSITESQRYQIYRVFLYRQGPKLFRLPGRIDRACRLDPTAYLAKVG